MSIQIPLIAYGLLMLSLAVVVRWESVRRRKGPSLKPGDLHQLGKPLISYTPPPDRPRRSLDPIHR
jgi:hypothetical protein